MKTFQSELPESTFHSLQLHLTAVRQYENQGKEEKIVKHMNSFIKLLKNQKDSGHLSDDIFKVLKQDAEIVIANWQ